MSGAVNAHLKKVTGNRVVLNGFQPVLNHFDLGATQTIDSFSCLAQ
jgi:hypothetical protein